MKRIRKYSLIWFVQRLGCIALALAVICMMGLADPPRTAEAETEDELLISDVFNEAEVPTLYDVPLADDLQIYISDICGFVDIDPLLVLVVIEVESQYNPEVVGDNGNSLGLMQIQPRWHKVRMDELGCQDLLDPYQNVMVGIDILTEKLDKYQDTEKALMAYNAGDSGAKKMYFDKGIYSNGYSQAVLRAMKEIEVRDV